MKKSNAFLIIGCVMILVAVIFIIFALSHPEMSFTVSNDVTYTIYVVYLIVTAVMLITAKRKN
jgi:protein-S-isoprenylcysteine O-methyltransferase Ste14